MNLILLGPQGSGKGTQAALLAKDFNLYHIEMGKILRGVAKSDNKYAQEIGRTLKTGNLVPDAYVRLIAWDVISKYHDKYAGFIFEGYPRSVTQYEQLGEMLKQFGKRLDRVFLLTISEQESIKRLADRQTCEKCGEIFNLTSNPPKVFGICDKCGSALTQREDDKPEAVKRRLQIFWHQTRPVFTQAERDGISVEIDGERPIRIIHQELLGLCQRLT